LGGITRHGIIEVASISGMQVEQCPFTLEELIQSKGAFVSSTTKHILPVTKVNGIEISDGRVCSEIKELIASYKKYIDQQIKPLDIIG
jgi:branched-subunit amino acid aminotransferase/4-amino-4-deoxychorismate lyase